MSSRARRFLIFTLRGDRYAMNVSDLSEVMETPPTFPIPKAPKTFLGVMNFHGTPTPVLDLAAFLHGDPPENSGRILILDHKIGSLALRIDTVERIISDIRGLQIQQQEEGFLRATVDHLQYRKDTAFSYRHAYDGTGERNSHRMQEKRKFRWSKGRTGMIPARRTA